MQPNSFCSKKFNSRKNFSLCSKGLGTSSLTETAQGYLHIPLQPSTNSHPRPTTNLNHPLDSEKLKIGKLYV